VSQQFDNNKNYTLLYTKQAQKDAKNISRSNLRSKVEVLLELLAEDPFYTL